MKKAIATLITIGSVLVTPLSALAAPETMPDGGIFDAEYYAQNNPDVVAAFGTDTNMLYKHYLLAGRAEGRKPYADSQVNVNSTVLPDKSVFDPEYYAKTYPDVAAAYSNDPYLLYQHYIQFGQKEGRLAHAPIIPPVMTSDGITEDIAHQRLIALKPMFPEGMRWDSNTPGYYYQGFEAEYLGYECVGYACTINDLVFGNTHNARYIYNRDHTYFHVGDIVRLGGHSVVILEVNNKGIICTEGNYDSKVHWGRLIKWASVDRSLCYIITRYEINAPIDNSLMDYEDIDIFEPEFTIWF